MSALPTRADLSGAPTRSELQTILLAMYDMVAQRLAAGTTGAGTATDAELLLARNSIGLGAGADIASAATLDLTARGNEIVRVTGTTAITALSMNNGQRCELIAVGALPLTYNAATLPLKGAVSYTCAAGDRAYVFRDGNGDYGAEVFKKDGTPIATTAASASVAGVVEIATDTEVQTGTDTSRVPSVSSMRNGLLVSGSLVATTSGTTAESTGIPSWAKRVTMTLVGVSVNGTGNILVQAGTSGGFVTTGYLGAGVVITDAAATSGFVTTTGFDINTLSASNVLYGRITLTKHDGNTWVVDGVLGNTAAASCFIVGGSIALAGALDRVRLATTGGNAFDAGAFKVHCE